MTIPAALDRAAAAYGDRPFLVEPGRRLSFAETRTAARAVGRALLGSGIEAGDRVVLWAPNSADWVVACLGAHCAGAVVVPVNTRYRAEEARYLVATSRAALAVVTTDFLGADHAAPLADLVETVVLSGPGSVSWPDFLARGATVDDADLDRRAAAIRPTDLCDIMFTSGTTGHPKGVMLDHGQTLRILAIWNDLLGFRPGDRYLVLNPFFHMFGYKYGWLCSLLAGVTVYPMAVFDPDAMLDLVERERITIVPGQPTVFKALMDAHRRSARDLGSLRLAIIGSTSIPAQIVHDMREVLGFDHVVTGYGLTETTGEVSLSRLADDIDVVATSVGEPLPGVEVRTAGTGEVLVRGFNVMRGYYDEPALTAEAVDADGWLHTGDLGHLDADGRLHIVGRLKDIYIVGGFNVAPAEVEACLGRHPAVRDAAVVGVPDDRLGEVGFAFVVVHDGATVTADELVAWCRERLATYKAPRRIAFVDALPYNAIGKLDKTTLRARAALSTGS